MLTFFSFTSGLLSPGSFLSAHKHAVLSPILSKNRKRSCNPTPTSALLLFPNILSRDWLSPNPTPPSCHLLPQYASLPTKLTQSKCPMTSALCKALGNFHPSHTGLGSAQPVPSFFLYCLPSSAAKDYCKISDSYSTGFLVSSSVV